MYGALPNGLVIQEINIVKLNIMCRTRNGLLAIIARRKDQSFMEMTVTKLSGNNFEDFDLDLQGSDRREFGLSEILIDYLLHHNNEGIMMRYGTQERRKSIILYVECSKKFTYHTLSNPGRSGTQSKV